MGTLSPNPWDLSLSGQNASLNRATAVALHSGIRIGALVASLRCHILRAGANTLSEPTCKSQPKPHQILTTPVLLVLRRRVCRSSDGCLGASDRGETRLHPAGPSRAERLYRELQRPALGWIPERRDLFQPDRRTAKAGAL